MVILDACLDSLEPRRWSLRSQMVGLGCQDTNWVGGNDKEVLDAILLLNGLILATLSMNKGKYGYLGCSFGLFGAPRWSLGSHMADSGCQDRKWAGGF